MSHIKIKKHTHTYKSIYVSAPSNLRTYQTHALIKEKGGGSRRPSSTKLTTPRFVSARTSHTTYTHTYTHTYTYTYTHTHTRIMYILSIGIIHIY